MGGKYFFTVQSVAVVDKEVSEMDFTTIGTLSSYVRQKNLRFAANYKTQTGQKVADAEGNLKFAKSEASEQTKEKKSDEEVSAVKLASIRQKLASGGKLSSEELSYLQQRDPKTYKKAKHADEAREELKSELKKSKTKQEARQAVTHAMMKASAEASADMAAYKSNSKTSGDTDNVDKAIQAEDIKNSLDSTTAEYQNKNGSYTSWNKDMVGAIDFFAESEKIYTENFDEQEDENIFDSSSTKQNSKNNSALKSSDDNSDSPQEITERFIMTIRALEAEWAEFTKSKEYADMPYNKLEEDLLNIIGVRENNFNTLDKPNGKVLGAVNAYRKAMLYKNDNLIFAAE